MERAERKYPASRLKTVRDHHSYDEGTRSYEEQPKGLEKNNEIIKMKNQNYIFSSVEKEQTSYIAIWLIDNQQNRKLVWSPRCLVPSQVGPLQALPLPRSLTAGQPGKINRKAPTDLCARILIPAKSTKKQKLWNNLNFS